MARADRSGAGDLSGYSAAWYETFGQPAEWLTRAQVDFVRRHAGPGPEVLDACCSMGRHSLALARAGCRVVGVDASRHAIDLARRRAPDATNPEFVCAPIEDFCMSIGRSFDTVICLWQSLGLGTREDTAAQLAALARVLADDGHLIIDLYNRTWWETHCGFQTRVINGSPVHIASVLTGDRLHVHHTFPGPDGSHFAEFDWVVFDSEEFGTIADRAGLAVILACCGFNESSRPGGGNSMQFVLTRVAETRPDGPMSR